MCQMCSANVHFYIYIVFTSCLLLSHLSTISRIKLKYKLKSSIWFLTSIQNKYTCNTKLIYIGRVVGFLRRLFSRPIFVFCNLAVIFRKDQSEVATKLINTNVKYPTVNHHLPKLKYSSLYPMDNGL